jgi:peptidoglycan/xylan/chitin deacetylase (PgdA/CDA1 family)
LKRKGLPATVYLASGFVGTEARFPHDRLYHLLTLALRAERRPGRNVLAREAMALQAAGEVDELIARRPAGALLQLIARMEEGLGGGGELLPAAGEVLSWEMVRAMAAAGVEFGAHTVNHVVLTHESDEALEREVLASKREIEVQVRRPVIDFAYPNGYYDRRVVAALVRNGFRSAVTTEDLPNRVGGDPYRLRRKTLWENYSRGPFGYSPALTACHLDDVFTMLALTRPVAGEQGRPREPTNVLQVVRA